MSVELGPALKSLSIRDDTPGLQSRINTCLNDVNRLNARIYEIEELRHSTSSAPARLDALLGSLDSSIAELQAKVDAVQADCKSLDRAESRSADVAEAADDLQQEWQKALAQVRLVKEEMREDGWLVRFRTTADQAEAMMEPLQKSWSTCLQYVEKIQASPQPVQYESDEDDELSISHLKSLAKSHEAMKGTYVPSIAKILRMMDRSINDRSTFNGEALRRFSEMSSRWTALQRSLSQLDAKIRLLFEQYELSPAGEPIEVLINTLSPNEATLADSDYFGVGKLPSGKSPHRASISSRSSSGPHRLVVSPGPLADVATISSSLKKRQSLGSTKATTPNDRPRWNASTKSSDSASNPASRRSSSHGAFPTSGSPAPPVPPLPDFAKAFPASRIPVRSPPRNSALLSPGARHAPSLSVSTTTSSILLSPPTSARTLRSPEPGYAAPSRTPRKSGVGLGITGAPGTPSMAQQAVSSSSVPRSHRMSMGRAPPSSFRSTTPTPSRPTSRMSNASNYHTTAAPLQPFLPSKYDLLDQEVQKILEETKWDLLVSRLDASLKKGQRKGDNDEWKGEFIFGAGEKATPVKLLKLNMTVQGRKEMRYKVMGRAAGSWMELGALLRRKMEQNQGIFD